MPRITSGVSTQYKVFHWIYSYSGDSYVHAQQTDSGLIVSYGWIC